jgi:hypothetical protein
VHRQAAADYLYVLSTAHLHFRDKLDVLCASEAVEECLQDSKYLNRGWPDMRWATLRRSLESLQDALHANTYQWFSKTGDREMLQRCLSPVAAK